MFVGDPKRDTQVGIGPQVVLDHTAWPLGGEHEVEAQRPTSLAHVHDTGDKLRHFGDQRREFVDDDELRRKMLNDLEELEAMVSATLAFGRDAKGAEPVSPIDLAELLQTVLDEAGDAQPAAAERLKYDGPQHLTVRARPLALKRALANLISNAVKYGGSAYVRLVQPTGTGPAQGFVRIDVEDEGPGIPPQELDRVFEPFHRIESSRNRETGGVGLGLPISRNILRAHGGDVTLTNRAGGGARATVLIPA